MQSLSLILLSFLATLVSSQTIAQELAQIPSCAVSCLSTAATSAGCSPTDYACQCSAKDALAKAAAPCVLAACATSDLLTLQNVTTKICALEASQAASSSSDSSTATSQGASSPSSTAGSTSTPIAGFSTTQQSPITTSQSSPASGSTHSSSSTTQQSKINTSQSSSTTKSSASTSASAPPAKTGLSAGAAAGIGVGVAIITLLLLGALVFFILRYKRRGAEVRRLSALGVNGVSELEGGDKAERSELQGTVNLGTEDGGGNFGGGGGDGQHGRAELYGGDAERRFDLKS